MVKNLYAVKNSEKKYKNDEYHQLCQFIGEDAEKCYRVSMAIDYTGHGKKQLSPHLQELVETCYKIEDAKEGQVHKKHAFFSEKDLEIEKKSRQCLKKIILDCNWYIDKLE